MPSPSAAKSVRAGATGSSQENWDAVVGARGRLTFGPEDRWFVPYYVDLGTQEQAQAATSLDDIADRVGKVLRAKPETKVFVWGDRKVPYGDVVELMAALQTAGAESVGLVTDDQPTKKL